MLNEKNERRYGPYFYNQELRNLKWELQRGRDMLMGEILVEGKAHYHHIDYNESNDNPDNHCWISIKTHMRITAQYRNPISITFEILLQNNFKVLKMGKIPQSWKYIIDPLNVRFPILIDFQREGIESIQKYWIDRVKNYRNWKSQKHWSKAKVTISSRIEKILYDSLKSLNTQKIIQNFVRKFLRNCEFREIFLETLSQQYERDIPIPVEGIDLTDWFGTLKNIYPYVVSGKVLTIEKELFTFYFTFCSEFSVSYAVRVALIHFRNELPQEPIERNEISPIMQDLLEAFIIKEEE